MLATIASGAGQPGNGPRLPRATNTARADRLGAGDIIGSTNDYRPNYAQGHNYWQTFEYRVGHLVVTGCAPQAPDARAPTHLLTGTCPAVR
jgi:hypothetical protein